MFFKVHVLSLFGQIYSYSVFLDVIINGVVFLISLSDYSLLMYRNKTDFCMLIFISGNFALFIISSNFFVWILWSFLDMGSCHLQIEILLSFQFGCLLFFFLSSALTTPNTTLNISSKSRHLCIVSEASYSITFRDTIVNFKKIMDFMS